MLFLVPTQTVAASDQCVLEGLFCACSPGYKGLLHSGAANNNSHSYFWPWRFGLLFVSCVVTILLSIQVCLCDIRVSIERPDHSCDMWVLFAPMFVILASVLCFVFFFFFFLITAIEITDLQRRYYWKNLVGMLVKKIPQYLLNCNSWCS